MAHTDFGTQSVTDEDRAYAGSRYSGPLSFDIAVTDDGSASGPPVALHRTFQNWRTIGALTFDRAVVSYNGDHVLHFNHPTWRTDRNDPATGTRVNGQKVRR